MFDNDDIAIRVLQVAGIAIAIAAILYFSERYWRRRLMRWAESERLELVSFRGAKFYQGPSAWFRSENQHVFRVVTRDRNGRERACWITFGSFWGFSGNSIWGFSGNSISEIDWDD